MNTIIWECTIHPVFGNAHAFTSKTDLSFLPLNQIKITSIFVSPLVWPARFDPNFENKFGHGPACSLCLVIWLQLAFSNIRRGLLAPFKKQLMTWCFYSFTLTLGVIVNHVDHVKTLSMNFPVSKVQILSNLQRLEIIISPLNEFPSSKDFHFLTV